MSLSGANNVPLGFGDGPSMGKGGSGPSLLNPSYLQGTKRESDNNSGGDSDGSKAERKRRKKSRWGGNEQEKAFIPGMPTMIPANMNKDQEEAYLLQLQIEEITRRLRTGDLGIPPNPEERSPSPEPIYNHEGKRLNTREYRTRKRLEDERHGLITRMIVVNREYKPPADYKPPIQRVSDKVMIPQDENPDINFIGLLIGPRGNTLKSLEKDTGAKIIIRGKGSVKEGKVGRKDGQPLPGEDEPLHAFVTAQNPESVKKAVDKIKEIIRQGIEVPEGQNDLRRMQLRELALLNGTLRENDGPRCSNCGSIAHRSWQCPDKPNVTSNVICTVCGGAGHIAKDCRMRKPGVLPTGADPAKIDEEYMSLMAELGEGPVPGMKQDDGKPGGMDSRFGGRPGLFEPRGAPRAIMGAPRQDGGPMSPWDKSLPGCPSPKQGGPFGGSPNFSGPRPGMFSGPSGMGNSGPGMGPPNMGPGSNQGPPQSWQQQQSSQGNPGGLSQSNPSGRYIPSGGPPPVMMQQPPPHGQQWMSQPPPPWMARPPPGPVPPPPRGGGGGGGNSGQNGNAPPPWQVPPPPPGASGRPGSGGVDINALAQAGLPNLLAAPPPPPPQ